MRNAHKFFEYSELLTLQDFQFKEKLLTVYEEESFIKMLEGNHIFDLMKNIKTAYPIAENVFTIWYDRYVELFEFLFHEDVFHKIQNADEFEYYRDLILEQNGMDFKKPNPNPEIQRMDDMWNLIQRKKGGIPTFEDKVSSVLLFYGGDILNLTLYQLDALYSRAIKYSSWTANLIGRMFSSEGELENWFINKESKVAEMTITDEDLQRGTTIVDLGDEHIPSKE